MKSHFYREEFAYDGSQLRPLFLYEKFDLSGDGVVAWIGACNIRPEWMVDGEDKKAGALICGDRMVHFIFEVFRADLVAAVGLQRLFASVIKDLLTEEFKVSSLRRDGDDLFLGDKKLSISIATRSTNSCLIHFAMNVVTSGTPVPTVALDELKVSPDKLIGLALARITREWSDILDASFKVFSK